MALNSKPSQADAILAHLNAHGTITPLEALERYGCFRLASRIFELRQRGIKIESESMRTPGGAEVARYRLTSPSPVAGQTALWD